MLTHTLLDSSVNSVLRDSCPSSQNEGTRRALGILNDPVGIPDPIADQVQKGFSLLLILATPHYLLGELEDCHIYYRNCVIFGSTPDLSTGYPNPIFSNMTTKNQKTKQRQKSSLHTVKCPLEGNSSQGRNHGCKRINV